MRAEFCFLFGVVVFVAFLNRGSVNVASWDDSSSVDAFEVISAGRVPHPFDVVPSDDCTKE